MKHLYSFFVCLFFSFSSYGQIAYHDALRLNSYIQPSGKLDTSRAAMKEYAAILKGYANNNSQDAATILQVYRNNPFIKEFIPAYAGGAGGNSISMNGLISTVAQKAGGLDVTNFADGMAKFLVERAKQELNTAFFEKFRKTLQDNGDLQLLFPRTYSSLLVVGSEIYNFQIYLNVLRESFEIDLANIIRNSRRFLESSKSLEDFRKNTKVYSSIRIAFDLTESIQAGEHPGEAIAMLATRPYLAEIDSSLYKSLRIYKIISSSLRSLEEDRYWISAEEFRKLENSSLLKIYLGLLYQNFPKDLITPYGKNYRKDILGAYATVPEQYFSTINRMMSNFQRLEASVVRLNEFKQNATGLDYYSLYNNVLSLMDNIYTELNGEKTEWEEEYKKFKNYAQLTGDIYLNASQRKYSMAIVNTVIFLDSLAKDKALSASVMKYGSFMAAVVQAENSDQVKQAIEAVALPSGSSRIKRESLWNISVNAYLGGYGGAEYIQKLQRGNLKGSVGLSAPIGIAFSRGSKFLRKDKSKGGWSYTTFISFIDLGAVAAFRIKDSTTAALPQLKLENILAPGLYLIAGIPKSPLSLGMFCQYGPSLRSVSAQNISVTSYNETTWRFGGMLAIDIPLLTLYNKGR
jgi:hypothetical protein